MACFLVPATEAIVTTIVAKAVKSHEAKAEDQTKVKALSEDKLPLSKKITRLSGFLWGGSGLLAFEHLWHGEISPFFLFLVKATASDRQQSRIYSDNEYRIKFQPLRCM